MSEDQTIFTELNFIDINLDMSEAQECAASLEDHIFHILLCDTSAASEASVGEGNMSWILPRDDGTRHQAGNVPEADIENHRLEFPDPVPANAPSIIV
jgi:hypothetical protein